MTEKVRERAAAEDWQAVLELCADLDDALAPDLMSLHLHAAAKLQQDGPIQAIVASLQRAESDDPLRLRIAGELITLGRPDDAWTVVQATGPDADILPLIRQIVRFSGNPEIRRAAARFRQVPQDGAPLPAAGIRIPIEDRPRKSKRPPLSRLTVIAPPHLAHHRERVLEMDREFVERVRSRPQPSLRQYAHVYVNGSGQVWTEAGEVVRSRGRDVPDAVPSPVRTVGEAFLCIETTGNFYHWVLDQLGALGCLPPGDPRPRLLVAADPPPHEIESLQMLGWAPEDLVRVDEPVFCETLLVAERPLASLAQWSKIGGAYDALVADAFARFPGRSWPKRIIVFDKEYERRPLENEAEFFKRLEEFKFTPVLLSKLSLAEQIETCRRAERIVLLRHTGLSHLVMADPGTKILEMVPIRSHNYNTIMNMVRLSRCRGHDHVLWLEELNPASKRWAVDLDRVERFMERWVA